MFDFLFSKYKKLDSQFNTLNADVDAHKAAAAPHSGHETPAGAQAKANAALNSAKAYTDQEVGEVSQALKAHDDALATKETPAGAQAKAEAAVAAHNTNVAAHGGIYRKNLLHNWDFRNPVNQRGQSSYNVANYTIDRWRTNDANISVNINSGYITVSNNGTAEKHFLQQLEFMAPGDYTVSLLLANGDILSESLNVNDLVAGGSGGSSVKNLTAGLKVQIGDFSSKPAFKLFIVPGYSFNIVAIKLELGSVSTLANDPPADYGEQLALCQRYALVLGAGSYSFRACKYDNGAITFIIPTPVTMRISPTFVGTLTVMSAGVAQTGFTFSVYRNAGSLAVVASKPAHGLTDAWLVVSANTLFSADL